MKMIAISTIKCLLVTAIAVMMVATSVLAEESAGREEGRIPAFPGAEGFGAYTPGGRGGKVYPVTSLEDYDENEEPVPGSLRQAVGADGPRIVIFRVSGIIKLKRKLSIRHPFITIAGQTAPGDGICISNQTLSLSSTPV